MSVIRCEPGFTLLEMLVALAVFALIAGVCYSALVPAGEGFRMLQHKRDTLESSYRLDRRLRMDAAYLMRSADKSLDSLTITHDQRGADSYDTLSMLVADGDSVAPVQVNYAIDETTGRIVRSSAMAWLRDPKPLSWPMQQASSFEVQALGMDGKWVDTWNNKDNRNTLPAALRVRWRAGEDGVQHELVLPIPIGGAAPNGQSPNTTPNVPPSNGQQPNGLPSNGASPNVPQPVAP